MQSEDSSVVDLTSSKSCEEPVVTFRLLDVLPIVSELVGQACEAHEVADQLVGYGLAHYCPSLEQFKLTPRSLSRLLLAVYHLPAFAAAADVPFLQLHLRDERRVFVLLTEQQPSAPIGSQRPWGVGAIAGPPLSPTVHLLPTSRQTGAVCISPLASFMSSWHAAQNLAVVASRDWTQLGVRGTSFFGGIRDGYDNYYWIHAECETDAGGQILRF